MTLSLIGPSVGTWVPPRCSHRLCSRDPTGPALRRITGTTQGTIPSTGQCRGKGPSRATSIALCIYLKEHAAANAVVREYAASSRLSALFALISYRSAVSSVVFASVMQYLLQRFRAVFAFLLTAVASNASTLARSSDSSRVVPCVRLPHCIRLGPFSARARVGSPSHGLLPGCVRCAVL